MRKVWLAVGLGAAGFAGYYYLWRIAPPAGHRTSRPTRSYDEAVARIRALQAAEGDEINPLCRTVLLDHGHATRRVFLLLHGYTNCPHQFHQLAPQLHAAGDTVFVPLQPLHGRVVRQPADLGRATPALLTAFLDEVVDIACGLGQELVVLGFSFGGVLAGWAATRRPEIRRAILVSPAFGLRAVPPHLRRLYANVLPRRRDEFRWWDPVLKEQKPGPEHAYLGYSTRGVGTLLQMSLLVEQAAQRHAPAAHSICVVINPSDEIVDNRAALALAELWRRQGADVKVVSFPAEDRLIHDLMDPAQPKQQVDKVYPFLLDVIGRPEVAP
ncbi:MAG TPA: alpha/beta fold hydrolase [Caldilineaceae bacterium]|nr:alpha/beta fold hydrolase [Caldilineaceae bacterium]